MLDLGCELVIVVVFGASEGVVVDDLKISLVSSVVSVFFVLMLDLGFRFDEIGAE